MSGKRREAASDVGLLVSGTTEVREPIKQADGSISQLSLRDAINIALTASTERCTADPAAGQIAPQVTATLTEGRTRLGAGSFTGETDLPQPVGGHNVSGNHS